MATALTEETAGKATGKPVIRVFIASPADVRPERLRTGQIISRLSREFEHHFHVEPVMFEREPLVATHHVQDAKNLPPPHSADIVVVILWTRLGVPLPVGQFRGAISGRPVTGTEWEFEDAMAGARAHGKPDLLVYRKRARPTVDLHDRKALEEQLAQIDLVEDFFLRWFRTPDGQQGTAASRSFTTVAEFEEQVYHHLHELLERRTGGRSEGTAVRWHRAPFRGLLPFDYEHSAVFFGRTRARNELRDLLSRQSARGEAFVLVLGASGSGKSSLVQAGLLADLKLPGMIARVALCRHAVLRPSDSPGDLLTGLAAALLEDEALPELAALRYSTERLADLLRRAPESAVVPIEQGLDEASKKAGLSEVAEARLAIVIDQFEELFTIEGLSPSDRDGFVAALAALAKSGQVWIIATMRSDFYDRLETVPALARLAANEACYRLLPPDNSELGQIIREPAREAGLRFEFDSARGVSLDEVIRQAAASDRGTLPLLSFLLDQLWQRRNEHGELTFAAYEELGHLEGALGRRAEEVFTALPEEVQATLPRLLRALVTVSQGAQALFAARTASLDQFPPDGGRRRLINAFLDREARLLVAEEGDLPNASPRVRVAHEALLTHWERARDWIKERPADLRLEEQLEGEAERWAAAADRDKASLLRPGGLPLVEAEDLIARRPDELSPVAQDFIAMSGRRARRRQRLIAVSAGLFALLAIVATGAGIMARVEQRRAENTLDAAKKAVNVIVTDVADGLRDVAGMRTETIRTVLEGIQATVEQLARDAPNDLALSRLYLTMLDEFTTTYLTAGDLERARRSADSATRLARRLAGANPRDAEWQRFISVSLNKTGTVDLREGNISGAQAAYTEALAVMRGLVAREPDNRLWQRDLSVSLNGLGDVQIQIGDAVGALASYDESMTLVRSLADHQPSNLQLQREIALRLDRVGDIKLRLGDAAAAASSYEQAVLITRRLIKTDPVNDQWQHDYFIALSRAGDLELQQGLYPAALGRYQEALAIVRRLTERDPGNSQATWDVAVTLTKTGDAKLGAGNPDAPAADYEEAIATMRRLVQRDPGNNAWQRDLAVCLNKIGDLRLHKGDAAAALAAYSEGETIVRRLAQRDPQNLGWLRDVSVSLSKIGDLKLKTGDMKAALADYSQALETVRKIAAGDPGNFLSLRDLSVSLNRVGDIELATGQSAAAVKRFEESLGIARRLIQHDPANMLLQQDLAIVLNKFGDAKLKTGDPAAALASYKEGVSIVRQLTDQDSENAALESSLVVGLYKTATVEEGAERAAALKEALAILEKLQADNKLGADKASWPALLRQMLGPTP